jgi:anti-sigma B factor antagonist
VHMDLTRGRDADGRAVLGVSGDLDTAAADELRNAAVDAAADDPAGLVIDLPRVSFIDSSGLAALIAINNDMQAPRELTLLAPSRSVRRIFELTGLNPAFSITE